MALSPHNFPIIQLGHVYDVSKDADAAIIGTELPIFYFTANGPAARENDFTSNRASRHA